MILMLIKINILTTDSSNYAIAAILSQLNPLYKLTCNVTYHASEREGERAREREREREKGRERGRERGRCTGAL